MRLKLVSVVACTLALLLLLQLSACDVEAKKNKKNKKKGKKALEGNNQTTVSLKEDGNAGNLATNERQQNENPVTNKPPAPAAAAAKEESEPEPECGVFEAKTGSFPFVVSIVDEPSNDFGSGIFDWFDIDWGDLFGFGDGDDDDYDGWFRGANVAQLQARGRQQVIMEKGGKIETTLAKLAEAEERIKGFKGPKAERARAKIKELREKLLKQKLMEGKNENNNNNNNNKKPIKKDKNKSQAIARLNGSDRIFDFDGDDDDDDDDDYDDYDDYEQENTCWGVLIDKSRVMIPKSCWDELDGDGGVEFPTMRANGFVRLLKRSREKSFRNIIVSMKTPQKFRLPKEDQAKEGANQLNRICTDQLTINNDTILHVLQGPVINAAMKVKSMACPPGVDEKTVICIKNEFLDEDDDMEFDEGAILVASKGEKAKQLVGLYSEELDDKLNEYGNVFRFFQRFDPTSIK